MLVGGDKPGQAWSVRTYPVPKPSRRGIRWKASALRGLHRWNGEVMSKHPATIMVPALYNLMPAENVAMGWLNEIDALTTIRQRISCAAKITGWDAFTFHTQHNADRFFDSTIAAVRDTWIKEGILSTAALREARLQFGKPYDYHRIHARLVENLLFQSSLLEWLGHQAEDVPLRFHVIGTALLSALVATASMTFGTAVKSALKFGARWDESLRSLANARTEEEIGWSRFRQVRRLIEGVSSVSLAVAFDDLPEANAPARPFWYSPTAKDEPTLISTAEEAAAALETMNLASWSCDPSKSEKTPDEPIRGWLISPLHPLARRCRWSVSNYLLATPGSVSLFMDHIATLCRENLFQPPEEATVQNRFRLSRIKVTGP